MPTVRIKHNLKSNYSITQVNQLSQEGGKRWNLPEPTKLEHMQKFELIKYLQEAPETGELGSIVCLFSTAAVNLLLISVFKTICDT